MGTDSKLLIALLLSTGCSEPKPASTQVDAVERAPLRVAQVTLEQASPVRAGWAQAEGALLLALESGTLITVAPDGRAEPVPSVPGEQLSTEPITHFAARDAQTLLAFGPVPRWVQRDGVRAAVLPDFLSPPTGLTHAGSKVLWASQQGLFTASAGEWVRLDDDRGAVRDATTLVGFSRAGVDHAWVQRGASVQLLTLQTARVEWNRYPDISVRQLASLGDGRIAAITDRGVSVLSIDGAAHFHREAAGGELIATAIAGGGGWAWVLWGGSLLRTDGTHWEPLLTAATFSAGSSVAVDASGASAVVIDSNGRAFRVLAQEALRLSGVEEETWVTSTSLTLAASVEPDVLPAQVSFTLDGETLGTRTSAPFGWGLGGASTLELGALSDGAHQVEVSAELTDGGVLTSTRTFFFQEPQSADAGVAPSYASDIKPVYDVRCAHCHSRPVARNLSTYATLSADLPVLRSALSTRRMPTDVLLDRPTLTLFLKWIDRGAQP